MTVKFNAYNKRAKVTYFGKLFDDMFKKSSSKFKHEYLN